METIKVYADFDFLEQKEQVGELSYERVRGGDHFAFQFSHKWLKHHGDIVLSGDIMNVQGWQHPRQGSGVFGFVSDSFPDRWGRLLLDRRERMTAQKEHRPSRALSNYDYLSAFCNPTRNGGNRNKAAQTSQPVPPNNDCFTVVCRMKRKFPAWNFHTHYLVLAYPFPLTCLTPN